MILESYSAASPATMVELNTKTQTKTAEIEFVGTVHFTWTTFGPRMSPRILIADAAAKLNLLRGLRMRHEASSAATRLTQESSAPAAIDARAFTCYLLQHQRQQLPLNLCVSLHYLHCQESNTITMQNSSTLLLQWTERRESQQQQDAEMMPTTTRAKQSGLPPAAATNVGGNFTLESGAVSHFLLVVPMLLLRCVVSCRDVRRQWMRRLHQWSIYLFRAELKQTILK